MKLKLKPILFASILSLLVYFPVFLHLDSYPIILWDESRLAVNAVEMTQSHNFITPTFEGAPDMWNTKPPFLIWLQAGSMKLFGYNELAVRFPSALSALILSLIIAFFAYKLTRNWVTFFATALALVTSEGFIAIHIARTGDYDALLAFFSTLSTLFIFLMTEEEIPSRKNMYLYCFFVSMLFMVLTKASQGMLLLPAYAVYIFIRRQFKWIVSNKHTYIGLLIFLAGVFLYYFLRELDNPGYLKATWFNDYWGRYTTDADGSTHRYFYIDLLFNQGYSYWYSAILLSGLFAFVTKNQLLKRGLTFLIICAICIITFLTISKTNGKQYISAFYPLGSILVGIIAGLLYEGLINVLEIQKVFYKIGISILLTGFIFLNPYCNIIRQNISIQNRIVMFDEKIGQYINEESQKLGKSRPVLMVNPHYNACLLYYQEVLKSKGYNYTIRWSLPDSSYDCAGKTIILANTEVRDYFASRYEIEVMRQQGDFMTIFVKSKK